MMSCQLVRMELVNGLSYLADQWTYLLK